MPSEHSAPPPAQDIPPALLQTKTCLSCHRPLVTSSTTHDDDDEDIQALLLLSTLDSPSHSLCPFCRLRPTRSSSSSSSSSTPPPHSSTPHQFLYRPSPPDPVIQHRQALHHPDHVYPSGPSSPPLPSSFIPSRPVPIPARASPASSALSLDTASLSLRPHLTATLSSPYDNTPSPTLSTASSSSAVPHPDPAFDISTVRARPQPHYCLYPGSKFTGTQKSGRNSYDVTVDIVSVDFASSHLAGYLCIRGLTDDWPELTTYFDAEIVGGGGSGNGGSGGGRYGFATRKWGATEEDDMMHWARFPAFRHAKNKRLTSPTSPVIPSPSSPPPSSSPILGPAAANTHEASAVDPLGGGAVFMRWKERFLVPDHRVQDISGASFAGFYYVCVDVGSSSGEATMGGFYFHQHSEPYQQLSLRHVPEKASASFELR